VTAHYAVWESSHLFIYINMMDYQALPCPRGIHAKESDILKQTALTNTILKKAADT
jgi:hypothetical protein